MSQALRFGPMTLLSACWPEVPDFPEVPVVPEAPETPETPDFAGWTGVLEGCFLP